MTTNGRYGDIGREFLARAQAYLDEDDLLQASEKGWGAAALSVKSIAQRRGWRHGGHRHLFSAVTRLVEETGDEDLRAAFAAANTLHTNFYEDWLDRETVAAHLDQVAGFVAKLNELAE